MSHDDKALVQPTKIEHIFNDTDGLCDNCKHLYSSDFTSSTVKRNDWVQADPGCPMCGFFKYCIQPRHIYLDSLVLDKYRIYLRDHSDPGFQILAWVSPEHNLDAYPSEWGPEAAFTTTEPKFKDRARLIEAEKIDFRLVKGWLQSCRANHRSDGGDSHTGQLKDFSLIHCEKRQVVEAPPSCDYVALSYVWGQSQQTPRESSRPELPHDLPTSLQATIKDAITVTLNLGFKFLWVDQFCIDQSNPQKLRNQLNDMCRIYRSAVLTIVAAAGDDANFGLPGVSIPRHPQLQLTVRGITYAATYDDISSEVDCSKWCTRAWVYQEGVFSSRRLVFTPWQVSFVCHDSMWVESKETAEIKLDYSLDTFFRPLQMSASDPDLNQKPVSLLLEHISEYTRRNLTYDSDAINGMRGIFESFKQSSAILNHWGLPVKTKEGFKDAMGWVSVKLGMVRRPNFPSWSWAGWKTEVYFEKNGASKLHPEFQVSFQKESDGTFTEPAKTFLPGVTSQLDLSPPIYSMNLRIKAIMYKVPPESFKFRSTSLKIIIRSTIYPDFGFWFSSPVLTSFQEAAVRKGDTYVVHTQEWAGILVCSYQGRAERMNICTWSNMDISKCLDGELRTIVLS